MISNLPIIPNKVFKLLSILINAEFRNCSLKSLYKYNFKDGTELSELRLSCNKISRVPSEVFANLLKLTRLEQ